MMRKIWIVPTMVTVLALCLVACTSIEPTPDVSMDSSMDDGVMDSYGIPQNNDSIYRNGRRMTDDAEYRATGDGLLSRGHGAMAKDKVEREINRIKESAEDMLEDMDDMYMGGLERGYNEFYGDANSDGARA